MLGAGGHGRPCNREDGVQKRTRFIRENDWPVAHFKNALSLLEPHTNLVKKNKLNEIVQRSNYNKYDIKYHIMLRIFVTKNTFYAPLKMF